MKFIGFAHCLRTASQLERVTSYYKIITLITRLLAACRLHNKQQVTSFKRSVQHTVKNRDFCVKS